MPTHMTSSRPYLVRALYEWIADNGLTPYIVIDATQDVVAPREHVQEGRIVLNISMQAAHELNLSNEAVQFKARFAGKMEHIYAPMTAVVAIYAKENGQGMVFNEEDLDDQGTGEGAPPENAPQKPPKRSKPNLKLVK